MGQVRSRLAMETRSGPGTSTDAGNDAFIAVIRDVRVGVSTRRGIMTEPRVFTLGSAF
jgi:hypothetical protein